MDYMKKGKFKICIISIFIIIFAILCAFMSNLFFNNSKISKNNNVLQDLNIATNNIISNTSVNNTIVDNSINEIHAEITDDLFSNYYAEADSILESMSIDEKVGQMFLARFPGDNVVNEIKEDNPGGYILFAKDFKNESKDSIKSKLSSYQESSNIPLIFGVDEEGGTVVRVSSYTSFRSSPFKSPRDVYSSSGMDGVLADSHEKSVLLKSIGINMNLTPVVDLPSSSSDFIYKRSFSTDLNLTTEFTRNIINMMNEDNIISCMKHFPGYGNNVDTHTGISFDKREYSNFLNRDFVPFEEGIKNNAPTILVSHNIVSCMDKDFPASLSKNVHDILRNDLNFSGLIITDDLAMDAVKSYVTDNSAAIQAVLAGNDMIISSDFKKQKDEVINAINNNIIPINLINNAVRKILACKIAYDII